MIWNRRPAILAVLAVEDARMTVSAFLNLAIQKIRSIASATNAAFPVAPTAISAAILSIALVSPCRLSPTLSRPDSVAALSQRLKCNRTQVAHFAEVSTMKAHSGLTTESKHETQE